MPWYRFGEHTAHVRMTSTKKRPAPLQCRAPHVWPDGATRACAAISTRLCDAPVGDATCDMPICDEHATSAGPDRDLCPNHARQA